MKKKTIIHITNWLLLFSLPLILLMAEVDTDTISADFSAKNLATHFMVPIEQPTLVAEPEEKIEKNNDEDSSNEVEEKIENKKIDITKPEEKKEESIPADVQKEPEKPKVSDVLATYSGNMSFYRANCSGCSGVTSSGYDVSDGRLFYNDSTYGNVRIVAGGSELSNYSIIRIKNSSFGGDVLAIKLDRGGDIGLGRRFLIDMLTNSTEAKGGVDRNIIVEVLRNGRG